MMAMHWEERDPPGAPDLHRRVQSLLNLFRLLVAATLGASFLWVGPPPLVGWAHPSLFGPVVGIYLVAAVLQAALLRFGRPGDAVDPSVRGILDISVLLLLTYASGGAESGLGMTLIVPVGALSVMLTDRGGRLVVAAAVIGLLVQQGVVFGENLSSAVGFVQAGYYGAMLLASSFSGAFLARRLSETAAVIRQRDIDLHNLAELSEQVVKHLRDCVMVVDPAGRLRLLNEQAGDLLGPSARPGADLAAVSPALRDQLETWRHDPKAPRGGATLLSADGTREVEAEFAALGTSASPPTLIFLTDVGALRERTQQTKLAALGRLSAGIAHEIRNPVGAMSQAAQLLQENDALAAQDRRLAIIISTNAERVSAIIQSVMQLSRRDATHPQVMALDGWLESFRQEFQATLELADGRIVWTAVEPSMEIRFDPTHLRQILWNLCENAVQHTVGSAAGSESVEVRARRLPGGRGVLEVLDRGPGIAPADAERVFEPFYTRRHGGTGLGLYIARELALCNGALLLHEPRGGGGSVFRIVFSDTTAL
jgi:two-component system, NtrC family, sensor histidine kinase PilS